MSCTCILNKIHRTGTSFFFFVDIIVEILMIAIPTVMHLPSGAMGGFLRFLDLVTIEAVIWRGGQGHPPP